jgi:ubiquinone/menaquinone biosynthesis C-methylase UbiE
MAYEKWVYVGFKERLLRGKTSVRIMAKKTSKAVFLLIVDWAEFKQRLRGFLCLLRRYRIKSIMKKQTLFFPESDLAHKYCIGKGLEIGGSAHNPFGLNTLNVDYSDSMDTISKKNEIRFCGKALKVDIVANGDDIPLSDESQDFIVGSHIIEHFTNPIKALVEWDRLVKFGGIIFMIVPHKERTFEKEKKSTPIGHLIEDFQNNNTRPHGKPYEHEHCWVTETFIELIRYMIEKLHMGWEIAEIQDVDDKVGNGFTIVIRKIKRLKTIKHEL